MNCITDFLPDDSSEHNADGESIEEVVFGIQPAPETLTPEALDAAIYGTPEYWEAMSSASVEAHTETLEQVKALEAENARLRAALESLYRKANSLADYYPEPGAEQSSYVVDAPEVFNDIRDAALKALAPK